MENVDLKDSETSLFAEAKMALGTKIRFMRENPIKERGVGSRKVKGAELAQNIGCVQGAVGNYETGKRLPSLHTLNLICSFLGYSIKDALPDDLSQKECLYTHWGVSGLDGGLLVFTEGSRMTTAKGQSEVKVLFCVKLKPGKFADAESVGEEQRVVSSTVGAPSNSAFALIYNGSKMGEALEYQQVIILDESDLTNGDLCMLRQKDSFMYCVFENESPTGLVFRLKGTNKKKIFSREDGLVVYRVIALRNVSDVKQGVCLH